MMIGRSGLMELRRSKVSQPFLTTVSAAATEESSSLEEAVSSQGWYWEGCSQDSIFVEVYLHNECAFNGLGFAYLGPCGKTKLPLQVLSAKLSVFNPHPAIASRSS
jgi:hypothetical protein